MDNQRIKMAIFQPSNIRTTNAFYSGPHSIFKYLQENCNYEVTYFIDDESTKFNSIAIKYLKEDKLKTFFLRGLRKIFGTFKYYWKIPYYQNLDFNAYDVIVTEGIHWPFLDYFKSIPNKVILQDSISYYYQLSHNQRKYLNKYFDTSLAVVVNDKIPVLYKANNLEISNEIIGYAVDLSLISFLERRECKGRLVSVGRLVQEKGFEYIIKAIASLKDKYPNIMLDIYGQGDLRDRLQKLIQSLGLDNMVFLKGFLRHEDLLKKLNSYDLFVSCPISTENWEEYFGMANLEALASGLPVITTDSGAITFVMKDKAVILEQKNENQIAMAIENFINNPRLVQSYSIGGRKYVQENYSVPVVANKWDKAIKGFLYGV